MTTARSIIASDAAVDFVMRAAASEPDDLAAIAAVLREWTG